MAIPDEKIEEIRAAVDIVDVVSDYVQLKRSGSRYKGLCPFHQEKTPSFSIDPDKNLYYCFGCGAGGDVFTFLQEIESVSFIESARMLAERTGIPLPEDDIDPEQASKTEAIYHALRFAGRFFYRQLTQTERGAPALDYLRERGFTPQTIKRFGLGYAPDAWDALLNAAEAKQIEPEVLEEAGLVIERKDGSGYYDRYRNRIIFPIFSHVGKVLGFGGRILDDDADQPKYINSPETRVYHKSKVLYGLRRAKSEIRQTEEALLVEGYTDVIALHQAGIENAVASSGTSLTPEQVEALGRYGKRIVLLYDADEAGARAAIKGLNLVLGQGLGAYAVELPEGEDPDSFVQTHGAEAFEEYIAGERRDMPEFRYQRARREGALGTPEDRVDVQRKIVASIARIPDQNLQREYVRRTSDVLDVPDTDLFRMLDEELEKRQQEERRRDRREHKRTAREEKQEQTTASGSDEGEASPKPSDPEEVPPAPLPEEKILFRLMLDRGTPMVEFILGNMALDEFTKGPPRRLVQSLIEMYEEGSVDPQRVLDGHFGPEVQRLGASVMMDEHEPSKHWVRRQNITVPRLNEQPYEAGASAMMLLKLDRVNAAIEAQRQKIYQADRSGDEDQMRALQNEMMALQQLRKQIKRKEFLEWAEAT